MPGYGPHMRVDGPFPLPPVRGLLPAADAPAAGVRLVPEPDDRWLNGVLVYPFPPDLGDVFDPCAPGSVATVKGYGTDVPNPDFGAMTVWLAETCTSARVWSQEEFKARAVAALSAVESAAVAYEFMHGLRMPDNPHLSDGNGTFPEGNTTVPVALGLAVLEGEIAASGKLGLIHCSPTVATIMRERFTIDDKTGVIRTINGNVVIPDAGYRGGATPTGRTAPGTHQEWIYATGPIDIRRSEMFTTPDNVTQALDRGTGGASGNDLPNSITYRAERYYLVDWDTEIQSAVKVDLTT